LIRDQHIKEHPECEACGSNKAIQVHHIHPFHLYPEMELDPDNLITLCMDEFDCHLALGHGDSFKCYNPNVVSDCERFRKSPPEERILVLESARRSRLKD
jgi:hypothetical protein